MCVWSCGRSSESYLGKFLLVMRNHVFSPLLIFFADILQLSMIGGTVFADCSLNEHFGHEGQKVDVMTCGLLRSHLSSSLAAKNAKMPAQRTVSRPMTQPKNPRIL